MAKLTLMCGIPASGKSTIAKEKYGIDHIILSSDALRAQFGSGESDQSVSGKVFGFMEDAARYLIWQGHNVCIDATNLTTKARAPFIEIAKNYGAPVEVCFVDVSLETALRRNSMRGRIVPEDAIRRMAKNMQPPSLTEADCVRVCDNEKTLAL